MDPVKLKRFGIYHPKDGFINALCKVDVCDYEYATSVESETLVRVPYRAMSGLNPAYAKTGKRNTTIGDIITYGNKVYMIKDHGFKRIPTTKDLYKNIMATDEAIVEILSRQTLSEDDVNDLIENSL